MDTDALGRRRTAAQQVGLRPLFPRLPADFLTRSIRVAMPAGSWQELDRRVEASRAPTRPRAVGEVLSRLLVDGAGRAREAGPASASSSYRRPESPGRQLDWLGWQVEKEQGLLGLH